MDLPERKPADKTAGGITHLILKIGKGQITLIPVLPE